ncbi:MAG: glycosyltransferase family 2 protein [Ignavibacteriae bacterium]|nr:glycosyltransferase family 2 protein [Ignavibacteria bacterium]MBI3365758.1 glycosyltransferase family 2 protein [Ignavibacteriota bacterium]
MRLSVIIPAYNEERTIRHILEKIFAVPIEKQVIVVDDCSTDGTSKILQEYAVARKIDLVRHTKNSGKGSAIRTGIRYIEGEVVIIQDADLEYDPGDYPALIQPIVERRADVVYGSRVMNQANSYSHFSFYLGGRLLSFLTNLLYHAHITDEPTCYKVFRTEVLKQIPLECTRFEFCPEVTAKVLKSGRQILEVPIRYYPRKKKEGKKIRWSDGLEAIWVLLKYRFTSNNLNDRRTTSEGIAQAPAGNNTVELISKDI